MKDAPEVEVRSRAELRAWLAENHTQSGSVWLVSYKASHPDYLSVEERVKELLCWGWIDSVPRRIDDIRTAILISPRKDSSAWSAVNKAYVTELRATGEMTQAGEAKITAAQANGMWEFLDDVDRLEVPDDLAKLLGDQRPTWDSYPPNVRRGTLEWLKTAKTDATRDKRLSGIVANAANGLRPPPYVKA
ncbi:YdeI/OmpD-associated family protein [Litoreibacter ponti]|uniref:YdeI/OmpD-associated family protein n=1 Tax=Litoreibacter ponti TaxID=1510457 RepID=UPI001304D96E|nr:YdeI/OmpD-associated family protein [Litoreibacter ponti]